jgi:hypothetical protein
MSHVTFAAVPKLPDVETFELTVKVLPTVWLLKLIWTGMFEPPKVPVDPEAEV